MSGYCLGALCRRGWVRNLEGGMRIVVFHVKHSLVQLLSQGWAGTYCRVRRQAMAMISSLSFHHLSSRFLINDVSRETFEPIFASRRDEKRKTSKIKSGVFFKLDV